MKNLLLICSLLVVICTSCNPMPVDDNYRCTIPITNNPNLIPQKSSGMPTAPI